MKRTFTNEQRRAQIVTAAIETIAELGYAKASFARITERAGLSSPRMISYHFADKDDLVQQIATEVCTAGGEFVVDRMRDAETHLERLRAYLEANLEFLRDHPERIAALTEIGPHLRTATGEPHTSTTAQDFSVRTLADQLAEGQAAGEFRDFDTRAMAVLIRSAVDSAGRRLREDPDFDVESYTREVVTTFTLATRSEPTP